MSTTEKFVIKIQNGTPINYPLLYSNLLLLHPVLTNQPFTNEVISPYGYEVFNHTTTPAPGVFEHLATIDGYVKVNGIWTYNWVSTPFTAEEIQIRTDQEWVNFRRKRNMYLRLTDWTQLLDTPLATEVQQLWTVYRQQLRDLPSTTTDPFNPAWPTPPSPIELFTSPLPITQPQ